MSVAVIAALPREIKGLVTGLRPEAAFLPRGVHLYRLPTGVAVTAGMGAARATLSFEAALEVGPVRTVISAGLAGACRGDVLAGSVLEGTLVVDARTGERFRTAASSAADPVTLATTEAIASVGEKQRLAASYGAAMVDMEAATLARLAQAHTLRFRALKGISDAHDFELASLSRFAGKHGQFRTAAFALHTALRPHHWRSAAKLGRNSNRALDALQTWLHRIADELA